MSVKFGEDILNSGGLRHLLNVLDKDALPFDVDTDTRQECGFLIFLLFYYLTFTPLPQFTLLKSPFLENKKFS